MFQTLSMSVLQTKGEIGILTCKRDEISAEKDLHKKNRSVKISDTFMFRTPKISDVFNFGQKFSP